MEAAERARCQRPRTPLQEGGGGLASGAEKHREGRAETPLASVARRSSAAPWGRGRDGDRGRLLLEACLRSRV